MWRFGSRLRRSDREIRRMSLRRSNEPRADLSGYTCRIHPSRLIRPSGACEEREHIQFCALARYNALVVPLPPRSGGRHGSFHEKRPST